MPSRVSYSPFFKREAVRMARESSRPVSAVARDLKISPSTLRRWMQEEAASTVQQAPDDESRAPIRDGEPRTAPVRLPAARQGGDPPAAAPTVPASAPDELFAFAARLGLGTRLAIITAIWLATVVASWRIGGLEDVQPIALVLHVTSLVLAFGAVLVVDWHGLLWLLRKRGLHESLRMAADTGVLIWLGLLGLLVSGPLLAPDMSRVLTWVKLLFVLGAALNGAALSRTRRLLEAVPVGASLQDLPVVLKRRILTSISISQLCWWGAIVIGFVTSAGRR